MKITRSLGKAFKPLVNFPRWMGLGQLRATGSHIVKIIKDLRTAPQRPAREETFEQAVKRMNLTEEDLKQRMKYCLTFSVIYFLIALAFLVYSVYMIIHGYLGAILGLLITALMGAFAFREHFWYFQIKTRRLGATPREWLSFLLRGVPK